MRTAIVVALAGAVVVGWSTGPERDGTIPLTAAQDTVIGAYCEADYTANPHDRCMYVAPEAVEACSVTPVDVDSLGAEPPDPGDPCLFVAPWGKQNPGDGSFGNPWAKPHTCVENMGPGDYCYLRDGTYDKNDTSVVAGDTYWLRTSGTCFADSLCTIKAYPGEVPLLLGDTSGGPPGIQPTVSVQGEYWVVDSLHIRFGKIGVGLSGGAGGRHFTVRWNHVYDYFAPAGNNGLIAISGDGNCGLLDTGCAGPGIVAYNIVHNMGSQSPSYLDWQNDPDAEHHPCFAVLSAGDSIRIVGNVCYNAPSVIYYKFGNPNYVAFDSNAVFSIVGTGHNRAHNAHFRHNVFFLGSAARITTDDDPISAQQHRVIMKGNTFVGTAGRSNSMFDFQSDTTDSIYSNFVWGEQSWSDVSSNVAADSNCYANTSAITISGGTYATWQSGGEDTNGDTLFVADSAAVFDDPTPDTTSSAIGDYTLVGRAAANCAATAGAEGHFSVLTRSAGVFALDGNAISKFGLRLANVLQSDTAADSMMAAMAAMKASGFQSFALNFQGGRATQGGNSNFSGFGSDGSLTTAYRDRLGTLLDSAEAANMVVVVQYFYRGQDQVLTTENDVRAGIVNLTNYLVRWRNVWIEALNEPTHAEYDHNILDSPSGFVEVYDSIIARDPARIAYVYTNAGAHHADLTCVDTWDRDCNASSPVNSSVAIEYLRFDEYNDPGDFTTAERTVTQSDILAAWNATNVYYFYHAAWHQKADAAFWPEFRPGGAGTGGAGTDADPGTSFAWDTIFGLQGAVP